VLCALEKVNDREEEMDFSDSVACDATKQTLNFTTKNNQGAVWLFKFVGMQMHGTLTINKNTLFRIVELKKS